MCVIKILNKIKIEKMTILILEVEIFCLLN